MNNLHPYLAVLLDYPREGFESTLMESLLLIAKATTMQATESHELRLTRQSLEQFAAEIATKSLEERQELYSHTFDINPVSCLNVGWHLYGEAYDRGAFLVKMRQLLREYEIKESTELPDHLIHVLPLLGTMPVEDANKFFQSFVLPGMNKMMEGVAGKSNPYEFLLQAVQAYLICTHTNEVGEPHNG